MASLSSPATQHWRNLARYLARHPIADAHLPEAA